MSASCIPKTAVNRLTEYLAAKCKAQGDGVHCIAFHPGGVRGDGVDGDRARVVGAAAERDADVGGGSGVVVEFTAGGVVERAVCGCAVGF